VHRHEMKAWISAAVLEIRRRRERLNDLGMATAEYAVVTVAACGFAGLLLAIVRSGEVRGLLLGIIRRALAV
jgi:hypothetical protein